MIKPTKTLLRPVGRAIADFNMIREGDRVLLAVSGGKDSLSLLHILRHLRACAPINFDFAVITVDPVIEGFDPSHLQDYYQSLGLEYFYIRQEIMEQAKDRIQGKSFCAYCSRMKRGIMYNTAREQGYNVLALGQHLDDLAESFLMSAFHGGQLRTMKAHYRNDEGDLRIIRPLVYAREKDLATFAAEVELPVVPDSCPACFSMPTQRQHMKELLAEEERSNAALFSSLLTAMQPLLTEGEIDGDLSLPEGGGDQDQQGINFETTE